MITQSRTAGMVTYNRRPRSLRGNLSAVLLQPVVFFRSLPATRHWLWVAVLMLIVTGFSAIHQRSAQDSAQTAEAPQVVMPPVDAGIPGGFEGGFIPPGDLGGGAAATTPAPDVSKTVMTALLAAGGVLLVWFIQALVLCEVSLINGARPSFGLNLQIAIWASVPLALMLVVQQLYFAIGGQAGQLGVSLLLERWSGYQTLPAFSQAVLMTLATNLTLFWLWNLALLYFAGRYALNGRYAAVMLVIVAWVIISTFLPALTSPGKPPTDIPAVTAPDNIDQLSPDMQPKETPAVDEVEMPVPPRSIRGGGG